MAKKTVAQLEAELEAVKKAAADAYERAVDEGSWCSSGQAEVASALRKVGVPIPVKDVEISMHLTLTLEGANESHVEVDDWSSTTSDKVDEALQKAIDGLEILPGLKLNFVEVYDVDVDM